MHRNFCSFFLLFLGACSGEAFQPTNPDATTPSKAGAGGEAAPQAGNGGSSGSNNTGAAGAGSTPAAGGTGGISEQAGSAGTGGLAGTGGASGAAGEENPGGTSQGGESGQAGQSNQGQAGAGGDSCEPGTFACDGERLLQCKGSPATMVPLLDCPGELCSAEQGICTVCAPGTVLGCKDEYTQVVCSENGTADALQPCTSETPFCDAENQGTCRACIKDEQCNDPPSWWCAIPVCKNFQCTEGAHVGLPDPELNFPGNCQKLVCAEDENGGPTLIFVEDPLDQPVNDPDKCEVGTCDGLNLVIEKKSTGSSCKKTNGNSGKCDGIGICQSCLPDEVYCEGNRRIVCKDNSPKENFAEWSGCGANTPACVEGQCVGLDALALGDAHSCALLGSGHVECWGENKYNQIGVSPGTTKIPTPTLIPGVSEIKQLALGSRHSCALNNAGQLYCWGDNAKGQLGSSSDGQQPALVEGLPPVSFLAAGGSTTCAITTDTKLFCWGDGEFGQTFVPAGVSKALLVPTEVTGAPVFSKIALGHRHGCGLTPDGAVHCWGDSTYSAASPPNTKVSLSGTFSELDVGNTHACVRGAGGFFCWGAPGPQLGSTFPQGQFTTVSLLAGSGTQLSLGASTLCQLTKSEKFTVDEVQCAGKNDRGQLGGTPVDASKPSVRLLPGASLLAVGGNHACAVAPVNPAQPESPAVLFCWGANESGQLGNDTFEDAPSPKQVVWIL